MSTIRRIIAVTAIAGSAAVAFANPASADPQKGDPLTLNCEDPVGDVDAVVFSNGPWSPALDTNSNVVLHPVAFAGVAVRVNGEVVETPPDVAKNGQRRGRELVECTFVQEFEASTPDGTITVTVTGTVIGSIPER